MEKTEKYLQAESVVIQPEKYDHRDVWKAQAYLDAYKDGYNKALSLSIVGQSLKCLMEEDNPNCNCKLSQCIKKGW